MASCLSLMVHDADIFSCADLPSVRPLSGNPKQCWWTVLVAHQSGHRTGLGSGSAFSAVKGEVRGCRASFWRVRHGPRNPVYTVCSKPAFAQGVENTTAYSGCPCAGGGRPGVLLEKLLPRKVQNADEQKEAREGGGEEGGRETPALESQQGPMPSFAHEIGGLAQWVLHLDGHCRRLDRL